MSFSLWALGAVWTAVAEPSASANRSHFLGRERSAVEVSAGGAKCGPLDLPQNANCKEVVEWAASGGKNDPSAGSWYYNMPSIAGVKYGEASVADFQRLYYCAPPGKDKFCGVPPCTGCSREPCNDCFAGHQMYASLRPGCDGNNRGLGCVPPKSAMGYKGQHWPTTVVYGVQEMHIFAIGDWGGMDGSLDTNEGRPNIVAYNWGKRPGPSVFPRSRWNKAHTVQFCDHKQLVECFNTRGQPPCIPECGYVPGVDDNPQILVANAFKARAALKDPQYILNVGDNFYWGGIEKTCGEPMNKISYPTKHQFDQIFEGVYQGAGLSGKPWFSVLGNHDWGGFKFDNGWDQQMSYTWASDRWVMPAPYYTTSVVYADLGFDVDYYFLDSNFVDAKPPEEDPNHNMCSRKNNKPSATCAAADGPVSVDSCPGWFAALWAEQKEWVSRLLPKSQATWQIAVTHFPCGHEQGFYKTLANMGLDLLITGHRHDQELWFPDDFAKNHMGITCIVTGGGGGITSEATPDPDHTEDWYGEAQYGFYDLTISKKEIFIESVNYDGEVLLTHTVYPDFDMAIKCSTLSFQPLGVGTNKWGTDPQKYNHNNIRSAFETSLAAGVTLLNTAQLYYTSENCIGKLRSEVPGGDKALVISKFDALSQKTDQLIPTLQESCQKCGVEAMDGFLIHHPKGTPEAMADQLAAAYQRGLVKNVGVSNYDEPALRQMHQLLKDRGVPLVFNEIEFSLLRRLPESNGLLKVCKELDVTVLAWAPLASGRLTSKPCTEQLSEAQTVACLEQMKILADRHKKTVAQVALNWCICKGTVPIPGARTLEQAQENAGALGWQLSTEEVAQLDAVSVDSMGMYNSPEAIYTFFGWWPPAVVRPICTGFLHCILALARKCVPLQDS